MEEEFRAILLASSGVTALVGTRVSLGRRLQGSGFPSVRTFKASSSNGHTMGGADSLVSARFQVDCYAETYGEIKALERAVYDALEGKSIGNFQGIFHAMTRDIDEGGSNEADRPFLVSMDFLTQWSA